MSASGQLPGSHVEEHIVLPEQTPCAHGVREDGPQLPSASQRPPSSNIAAPGRPLQLVEPQSVPTVRGDHSVEVRLGSHIWHTFDGFSVSAP